jgi:sterol desaturase/sphingolipid hydroxylase (fatty acid hydroxylase superfamily)
VDPTIVDHTLLPPSALAVMALGSIAGFTWWLGARLGLTAAICFHLGGLANGWVHLLTHMPYAPRTRFFRWVRRTHALHHFKNEGYWFAFTGPFVDVLFGTHRNPADVPTSAACAARHGRASQAPAEWDARGSAGG